MNSHNPIPPGIHTVTPHLVCANAAEAIAFYQNAFHAQEHFRVQGPDGKLMHALIQIGNSMVMLVDEYPECGSLGPNARNGTSVSLHLYVADADLQFQQAVDAGCTVRMPMADMFWGDRYGMVQDPFGHLWSIATHIRDVSPEEIQAAAAQGCPDPTRQGG